MVLFLRFWTWFQPYNKYFVLLMDYSICFTLCPYQPDIDVTQTVCKLHPPVSCCRLCLLHVFTSHNHMLTYNWGCATSHWNVPCDGITHCWKILNKQIVQQMNWKSGTLSNFQIFQTFFFIRNQIIYISWQSLCTLWTFTPHHETFHHSFNRILSRSLW